MLSAVFIALQIVAIASGKAAPRPHEAMAIQVHGACNGPALRQSLRRRQGAVLRCAGGQAGTAQLSITWPPGHGAQVRSQGSLPAPVLRCMEKRVVPQKVAPTASGAPCRAEVSVMVHLR